MEAERERRCGGGVPGVKTTKPLNPAEDPLLSPPSVTSPLHRAFQIKCHSKHLPRRDETLMKHTHTHTARCNNGSRRLATSCRGGGCVREFASVRACVRGARIRRNVPSYFLRASDRTVEARLVYIKLSSSHWLPKLRRLR